MDRLEISEGQLMSKKGRQIGGVIGILVIFGLVAGGIVVQRQHHQREVKIAQQQAKIKRQRQAQEAKKQRESQKVAAAKAKEERLKAESQPTIVAEQALDDYLKQIGFSGTALIVRDKQVLLDKGYGSANRAKQLVNTPDTLYVIGSTEKALIATSLLQLQEQGKLNVNDPISRYLPDFPNGQQIKLTDFLHHTSGIVGRNQGNQTKTLDQLIEEIIKNGIKEQPGKWHYMDANYIVLTKVLEKVSHQDYKTYLKEKILKPSKMAHTGFMTDQYSRLPAASIGYLANGAAGQLPNFTQLPGVGDMYMTATDMYRFDRALWTGKLINEQSKAQMFQPGSTSHYGMGFYNDPALIVNRGYLSGWNVSNGFSHGGRIYIVLFSNEKNEKVSLSKMNGELYTKITATI